MVATLAVMLNVIALCCAVLVLVFLGGCTRTVLVPEASPVRIGPDVRSKVYYLDPSGDWKLSDNCVIIPEGWYCVPPSYVEEK